VFTEWQARGSLNEAYASVEWRERGVNRRLMNSHRQVHPSQRIGGLAPKSKALADRITFIVAFDPKQPKAIVTALGRITTGWLHAFRLWDYQAV